MTLAEGEALFHAAVTGGTVDPARLRSCFAGSERQSAEARVGVYACMYQARLAEALRATFPLLAGHLGPERFDGLAGDYLRAHPSDDPDIGLVGRLLPAFLRRHPAPERSDLADLAGLEWTRHEVFFAPPAAAAGPEAFAALGPGEALRARLALSPALRLLRLGHDAPSLWRSLERGEPAPSPAPGPVAVAVWRSGFEVFHCSLSPDEAEALEGAASGAALDRVCAAFCGAADPAGAAHAALASWLAEGWIAGVVP